MVSSFNNRFFLIIVCYCFTITGCHKEMDSTEDDLPIKADTLWVEKDAGLWGYPETSMFVYSTSDTIIYNYSLKLGYSNIVVLLDGEEVPDSGWFMMDKSHHLEASCENKVIWKLGLEKQVYYGCPAVDKDGTIYISTGIFRWTDWGSLYAVNPDGTVKWSFDCQNNAYSPVIGQNGMVFIQDFHNTVYAVATTGELKWKFNDFENKLIVFYDMGQRIPAVGSDGTVYIASDGLYALNPENGNKLWRFNPLLGKSCRQSPVIGQDGTIYIFIHQCDFYAVNPDGTEKWHAKLDHEDEMTFSCPAIDKEGVLYIPAEKGLNGFVYAFNSDGTRRWKYTVEGFGRTVRSAPAFGADGTIYITTKSGGYDTPSKLIALSPSGSKIWEFIVETFHGINAADDTYATPSIGADGMIYFGSENEHFYCVNPDGTLNWKTHIAHSINWSSAAITQDGTLYVGTHLEDPQHRGNLYAIQTTSMGYADSPWPRFRQNHQNNGRYPDM
jgi:outer membrane protein assembly factor BamB